MTPPIKIRQARPGDLGFIMHAWLKSHRKSTWGALMTNAVYYDNHKVIVADILSSASVLCAVNPQDDDQLFGYIVFTPAEPNAVVHYMYIKQFVRGHGIGTKLFNFVSKDKRQPTLVTHVGHQFARLQDKWNLVYNPYVIEKVTA